MARWSSLSIRARSRVGASVGLTRPPWAPVQPPDPSLVLEISPGVPLLTETGATIALK
ncbi:hypothetical protein [Azospirillum argentinense]